MKKLTSLAILGILCCLFLAAAPWTASRQDWTNYVRIGAYSLKSDNTDQIIADVEAALRR